MRRKLWRFLIFAVAIITSTSLACQGSSLPAQAPTSEPAQQETKPESIPDETQPTKPVSLEAQNGKVGDVFQSGDITLFVPRWDNVLPREFTKPDVGKKYISADVILVNAGAVPTHFSSFDFYLKDDTGQKYDPDAMAAFSAGSDLLSGIEMAPGEKLWTRIGFQVPEDAAGLQLIYDSSDANSGKIFVELGQEPVAVNPPPQLPGETEQESYPDDQPIEVNGMSITINEVSFSSGAEYLKPGPGTQWLIVDLTVENKTLSSREFSSYIQLLLKDSTGWLCRQDAGVMVATGGSEPNGELTPGEKIRGQVGFVVPEGATGLLLMYDEDSYYPPSKVTIALTLP